MSDNMNLVAHVRRTEKGLTKMQIRLPISTRAGMAELSKRLGISQLALVRSALAAFLVANEAPVVPLVAPEVIAEAQPEEATEVIAEAQPEARPPRPSPRPRPQHLHHRQLPKQMPHGLRGIVLSCCRVSPRRPGSPAPSKRIPSPDTTNQGRHRDDDSDQHLRSSPWAQAQTQPG